MIEGTFYNLSLSFKTPVPEFETQNNERGRMISLNKPFNYIYLEASPCNAERLSVNVKIVLYQYSCPTIKLEIEDANADALEFFFDKLQGITGLDFATIFSNAQIIGDDLC